MDRDQLNLLYEKLYQKWDKLTPGSKAELRKVKQPDELYERPAFYKLLVSLGGQELGRPNVMRLVFCIPYIKPIDGEISLGAALAKSPRNISEKRVYQVVRSDSPTDFIYLRRLLQHTKPLKANWPAVARQLWYWSWQPESKGRTNAKRRLLEDFILNQPPKPAS